MRGIFYGLMLPWIGNILFITAACGPNIKKTHDSSPAAKTAEQKGAETHVHETSPARPGPAAPNDAKKMHCAVKDSSSEPKGHKKTESKEIKNPILKEIYQEGLTQANAVQFALVNNPDLLAFYNNLDIGYAELIEAGLRENPIISSSIRFPNEEGNAINKNFDGVISYLDYFLIPLRERAAAADLNVVEAQFTEKVLDLARDVQIHWLDVKSFELLLEQEGKRVQIKELAAGLADLQKKAGNISELNARARELEFLQAVERLKNIQVGLESAVEELSRSLGLFGPEACFRITGEIDWKSDVELPNITVIETAAIDNRPDIEIVRREVTAIAEEANLKQPWTYSNIKVGTSAEREPEGVTVVGPLIELELPIYNYGQGQAIKYNALLDQAQKRLLARAIEGCSEVREFFKAVNIFRSQVVDYDIKILPDFAKQVSTAQAHYNVMALGIYALLDVKDKELQASIEQLLAIKNYEKARIELFHAAGGSFASVRTRQ